MLSFPTRKRKCVWQSRYDDCSTVCWPFCGLRGLCKIIWQVISCVSFCRPRACRMAYQALVRVSHPPSRDELISSVGVNYAWVRLLVATLVGPGATLGGVGATASGYAGLPQSYAGCRTGKAKQTSHRCTAKLAILHICVLRSNPGLENPTPETTQPAKRLTFKGSRK